MSEKMDVYTVKVKKGKFKGRELKTTTYPTYIFGFGSPWIACWDEENNEYCIYWSDLKVINTEQYNVR